MTRPRGAGGRTGCRRGRRRRDRDRRRRGELAVGAEQAAPARGDVGRCGAGCTGDAPARDYFYWELHEGGGAKQAARFGDWKAVRNGVKRPIEIYDLNEDAAESKNLAADRADLAKKAEAIFNEAHRPDPNWPLEGRSAAHAQSAKEAWAIKRERDRTKWVPEGAVERQFD